MEARRPAFSELLATDLYDRLRSFGKGHDLDEGHALQVTRLALDLFDQTGAVHRLVAEDRRLLFSAAYLHDVGISRGLKGHHKSSLELISGADLSPLDRREQSIVASVARYHRKAHPKARHRHYSALSPGDRRRVARMAAVLRIADALDLAHEDAVKDLEVEVSSRLLRLRAFSARPLPAETEAVRKKGRLFEELFGLGVRVEAVRPGEGG
ncbi:MAG: HD domain-containing protein [Euryarchaeota archaeon]|nr:HD domain-containing protein [Euryarchaeota archaeon]